MSGFGEFDYGAFLGIGLDNNQLAYLAGALFLGLFGLSALRHAKNASGLLPAIWIAASIGLLGGTLVLLARGFPEYVPDGVKPWTETDRLARIAAILALLGCSLVLLSAHWVRGGLGKFWYRLVGLAIAGVAVWLAAGWFADEVPEEARPWTADHVLVRAVVVLSLICLAVAFWMRGNWSAPHVRWLNRALVPFILAVGLALASRWFIVPLWPAYPASQVEPIALVLVAIAIGTCLLIAAGAFLIREKPEPLKKVPKPIAIERPTKPRTPLPIATMLDERGQPVIPQNARHAGPAGA